MNLVAYIILFISIIILFKTKENFIYYFIPLNFLIDLISGLFEVGGILAIMRAILIFVFFILVYIKYSKTKILPSSLSIPVYSFLIFLLVLVLLSDNFSRSFSEYSKTAIILISFLTAYKIFASGNDILKLMRSFYLILVLTILNSIVSNFYSFGWGGYSEELKFYSGSIWANVWYTPAIAIVIIFELLNKRYTIWKKTTVLLLSVNFILIILSGRRTAYLIIIIAFVTYLVSIERKTYFIKLVLVLSFIIALSYPLFENILFSQYEARRPRIEAGLTTEFRYLETEELWQDILSFENLQFSLTGRSPFDTAGKYGSYIFGMRYLHIDINIIVFSAGLIGLLLYLFIHIKIYSHFFMSFKNYKVLPVNQDKLNFKYLFYTIFFVLVFVSFSGGLNSISFRSSAFIILGAIMGQINFIIKKNKLFNVSTN